MPVTHQWRHRWTFTAHNLLLLFTLHTSLRWVGQQNTRDTHTEACSKKGAYDVMEAQDFRFAHIKPSVEINPDFPC